MAFGEFKEQMKDLGVPRSFTNWAKNYLSRSGVDYDQIDISAYYDSSLSYSENQRNFESSFPSSAIPGNFSARQIEEMNRAREKEQREEEREHTEKQFLVEPTYENMGKLAGFRKHEKKEYEEPDTTNELELSGKELGIGEVGRLQRKPTSLEAAEEKLIGFKNKLELDILKHKPVQLTVAREKIVGLSEKIGHQIKQFQTKEREKRIANLKAREQNILLQKREKQAREAEANLRMRPVNAFADFRGHPQPRVRNIYSKESGGSFGFGTEQPKEEHHEIPLAFRESNESPAWLKNSGESPHWLREEKKRGKSIFEF